MTFFLKRKELSDNFVPPYHRVLTIDIGSSSVGAGYVNVYRDGSRPEVVATTRRYFAHKEIQAEAIEDAMFRAFNEVIHELRHMSVEAPLEHILVTIRSPWVTSSMRTIVKESHESFVFTKKIADDMIAREVDAIENKKNLKQVMLFEGNELIEHKTLHVRLNGYATNDPLGKKAKKVEITTYISILEKRLKERIVASCEKISSVDISFVSFLYTGLHALQSVMPKQQDMILVEAGGDISEITIIRDHVIQHVVSIPYGSNHALRELSLNLEISYAHARSLILSSHQGLFKKFLSHSIEKTLARSRERWSHFIMEALTLSRSVDHMPDFILVTGEAWQAHACADSINDSEHIREFLGRQKTKAIILDYPLLGGLVGYRSSAIRDPLITLEAYMAQTLL